MLRFLYHTKLGRVLLKVLTAPAVSGVCGRFLDSRCSCILIRPFIRLSSINMAEYREERYHCFNDFFCRRIRPECRPIEEEPAAFISPCDGLLRAYPIEDGLVIPVKESRYSIADLLRDEEMAARYEGGLCLVFRLCVNHYHRYCYPDSGFKSDNIFLPGILHTVQPIALRQVPVFTENAREYTVLVTENFGRVVQMEVGAMLVGKIANRKGEGPIRRGEEKGRFLYGGSTIILLVEKDRVKLPQRLFDATMQDREVPVKLGQRIGRACKK